ncbi:DsbA family protein [Amaricoccus macauensis]|uniref:DsbA family protein n=1 Tax=Amaricoccus macauensis TaxID=57001 RepID=UPI003C7EAA76
MTLLFDRRRTLALGLAFAFSPALGFAQEINDVVEMVEGDPDAPVTIIEYASFTCPHCATFNEEVMPRLKADFIDTGKAKLIFREVYFDRAGLWASMIARCAPKDRYFGLVDVLFERQSEWATAKTNEEFVENLYGIGRQAGLTNERMDACMSDQAYAEALVESYQKNAGADGIDSTPSFVINGEKYGNMNYETFAETLRAAGAE